MRKMKHFGGQVLSQRIRATRAPDIQVVPPESPKPEEPGLQPRETDSTPDESPGFIELKVISEAGMRRQRKKGRKGVEMTTRHRQGVSEKRDNPASRMESIRAI